jgi:hypothetical protein
MRIEIVNRFDGGWVVAADDLSNALSETSARTPATDPTAKDTSGQDGCCPIGGRTPRA